MHAVLCVLLGALGCTVQKAELESSGNLVLSCVRLDDGKPLLEVDDGGGDSALRLVDVLRKAPGGGSVKRGKAHSELWRVFGVRVSVVHVLLRVAQVVCASSVCVGADAVDGLCGVVRDRVLRDVERNKQVERGVSVRSNGSRPEACATGGGCLSFCALRAMGVVCDGGEGAAV
jgi:hypothetical protein